MSFFAPAPEPDEPDEVEDEATVDPPWLHEPRAVVPVVLPVSELVGATAHAALIVSGLQVYDIGVAFGVEARIRRDGLGDDDWDDLLERAGQLGRRRHRGRGSGSGPLRVGVQLADGTRALTDSGWGDPEDPAQPRLTQNGGGGSGSDRFWTQRWSYWLWPLPPNGPLTIVTEWTRLGLAEASTVVDGSAFSVLGWQARAIWPGEPDAGRGAQPTWSVGFVSASEGER